MTANEFLQALRTYIRTSPQNGSAQVCIRFEDTCFKDFKASNAEGLPGQHFLLLEPNYTGEHFKMREAKLAS